MTLSDHFNEERLDIGRVDYRVRCFIEVHMHIHLRIEFLHQESLPEELHSA